MPSAGWSRPKIPVHALTDEEFARRLDIPLADSEPTSAPSTPGRHARSRVSPSKPLHLAEDERFRLQEIVHGKCKERELLAAQWKENDHKTQEALDVIWKFGSLEERNTGVSLSESYAQVQPIKLPDGIDGLDPPHLVEALDLADPSKLRDFWIELENTRSQCDLELQTAAQVRETVLDIANRCYRRHKHNQAKLAARETEEFRRREELERVKEMERQKYEMMERQKREAEMKKIEEAERIKRVLEEERKKEKERKELETAWARQVIENERRQQEEERRVAEAREIQRQKEEEYRIMEAITRERQRQIQALQEQHDASVHMQALKDRYRAMKGGSRPRAISTSSSVFDRVPPGGFPQLGAPSPRTATKGVDTGGRRSALKYHRGSAVDSQMDELNNRLQGTHLEIGPNMGTPRSPFSPTLNSANADYTDGNDGWGASVPQQQQYPFNNHHHKRGYSFDELPANNGEVPGPTRPSGGPRNLTELATYVSQSGQVHTVGATPGSTSARAFSPQRPSPLNPRGQFRTPFEVEEVLDDDGYEDGWDDGASNHQYHHSAGGMPPAGGDQLYQYGDEGGMEEGEQDFIANGARGKMFPTANATPNPMTRRRSSGGSGRNSGWKGRRMNGMV